MARITKTLRTADRCGFLHVLSDGRAVREAGTAPLMLLTKVGGEFVRHLDSLDEVAGAEPAGRPHEGHHSRLSGSWFCDTCDSPYCEEA